MVYYLSGRLTENDDHAKVKNMMWSIRTLWRRIGESLGLAPEDLNKIDKKMRDDGECLGKVLEKWLRQAHTPERPITWKALVSALQQDQLKQETGAVVQEILEKYICRSDPGELFA